MNDCLILIILDIHRTSKAFFKIQNITSFLSILIIFKRKKDEIILLNYEE